MLDQNDLQAIAQLLQPINDRLDRVDSRLDRVDSRLDRVDSRLDGLEIGQKALEERLDEKICRVEEHLGEEIRHVRVLIESDVRKDIQVIAEQHGDIVEKLSITQEVDSLKGRVSTLEGVVKNHTADLVELKKAQ